MTERLIPFDLEEWRKRPQDLRFHQGDHPASQSMEAMGGLLVLWEHEKTATYYTEHQFQFLRLTAPASKRVEVRAALWASGGVTGRVTDFELAESDDQFVRWLTNWHIEGGKVFVEVE